jgi:hypothetical protein
MTSEGRLLVVVDGKPLPEPEARAIWKRFSDYMGEHPGDLAGFAAGEGFASAKPESRGGKALLILQSKRTKG